MVRNTNASRCQGPPRAQVYWRSEWFRRYCDSHHERISVPTKQARIVAVAVYPYQMGCGGRPAVQYQTTARCLCWQIRRGQCRVRQCRWVQPTIRVGTRWDRRRSSANDSVPIQGTCRSKDFCGVARTRRNGEQQQQQEQQRFLVIAIIICMDRIRTRPEHLCLDEPKHGTATYYGFRTHLETRTTGRPTCPWTIAHRGVPQRTKRQTVL